MLEINVVTMDVNLAAAVFPILVLCGVQRHSVFGILDWVATGTRVPIGQIERPCGCNTM